MEKNKETHPAQYSFPELSWEQGCMDTGRVAVRLFSENPPCCQLSQPVRLQVITLRYNKGFGRNQIFSSQAYKHLRGSPLAA